MKEEIKEKIDDIFWEVKKHPMDSDYLVKKEEMELLLDYITNLQDENERLKELCDKYEEEHNNEFKMWKDERHQLLDYKSRIDKAIIYLNTLEKREAYKIEDDENGVPQIKVDNEEYLIYCLYNKLLNILQGEDTNVKD